MKKTFPFILSIVLGGVFLFSAYAKLYPIELFEYTFINSGFISWKVAPYISRLAIGLEFILGALLILNIYFKKKQTLLASILLLLFFTFYLVLILITEGNISNCGCFGDALKFTPIESIIKNLVLLFLSLYLYKKHLGIQLKFEKTLVIILSLVSLSIPFALTPINFQSTEQNLEETLNYKLDLEPLYASGRNDIPKENLREGKRIIAFLSLTCPHCKLGAFKLHLMHKDNPNIPIYFVLNGEIQNLPSFLEESKSFDMPYTFMTAEEGFVKCAGVKLPAILWVENGIVVKKIKYKYLNQDEIETWLAK
jgi:hypothetical protein